MKLADWEGSGLPPARHVTGFAEILLGPVRFMFNNPSVVASLRSECVTGGYLITAPILRPSGMEYRATIGEQPGFGHLNQSRSGNSVRHVLGLCGRGTILALSVVILQTASSTRLNPPNHGYNNSFCWRLDCWIGPFTTDAVG